MRRGPVRARAVRAWLVTLLVDASASMSAKWAQVRSSVVEVAATNPTAQFGLTFFPTNAGCKTTTEPAVPVGLHEPESLGQWFDSHPPVGGTPLASAMNDMVLGAAANFGNYGGAIVLLSDGENACGDGWSDASMAAEAAEALHRDFGVRTFVIGFGFRGNEQQLEAIAAKGGTGLTTFVPAGDEEALYDALRALWSKTSRPACRITTERLPPWAGARALTGGPSRGETRRGQGPQTRSGRRLVIHGSGARADLARGVRVAIAAAGPRARGPRALPSDHREHAPARRRPRHPSLAPPPQARAAAEAPARSDLTSENR